jgi:hypothetical protein
MGIEKHLQNIENVKILQRSDDVRPQHILLTGIGTIKSVACQG